MVASLRFKNRRQFNKQLDDFSKNQVPEATVAFQKKIAIDLFGRIIDKNPVGNPSEWAPSSLPAPPGYVGGRSRGNWQISITVPAETSLIAIDAEGSATLTAGLGNLAQAKPFGAIWIFNNVRYITALEKGHSKQAPAGMVGVSLAEVTSFFQKGQ